MPKTGPEPHAEPGPLSGLPPGPPLCQINAGVATLTLNRPAHHNRLEPADLRALQQHFASLQALPGLRVLVLTATGKSFCSGFHLGALGESGHGPHAGPELFEQTVDALEALAVPTVCVMNGGVYGGAIDLALACDFRVGVDTLALRMPAARLGLHYYPSGLRRYVSRLGLRHAKRLLLLADTLHAPELLAMGFLDRMASAGTLAATAQNLVDALAAGAPLALRGMKSSLNELARGDDNLAELQARVAACAASDDLQEGIAALAQKRPPRFNGR